MNTILLQEEIKLTQRIYHTHRLLAQFAFSDDLMASELLQSRDNPSANWLTEATEFYQVVVPMAEFMLKCGVHKDELRQARAMVEAIVAQTVLTTFSDN